MPIKISILIIILGLFAGFLLLTAIRQEKQLVNSPQAVRISPAPTIEVKKNAQLFFVPSKIDANISSTGQNNIKTADIYLDSGPDDVSAFQLELSYDPGVIENLNITEPKDLFFFGNKYKILFKNIDLKNGRISFAVSAGQNNTYQKGIGKAGVISFEVNKGVKNGNLTSEIIFLDKTMISSPYSKESLLKNTVPLTINL